MSKVSRVVLADGTCHEVACSVRADGVTAPVVMLLSQLERHVWPDPNVKEFPDEYQSRTRYRFLALVEYLAQHGELETGFNRLEDGIWEFKVESLRVTFYDTPGGGHYIPKLGDEGPAWDGGKKVYFPEFDEYVRVGHYFGKKSQKTPRYEIEQSKLIREEDLAHDRD